VTAFTYTVPGNTLSAGSHTFAVRASTQYSAIGPQISGALSDVVFTSANNTSVINGTGGTFQVTTTGSPIGFSLTGAPSGVTIDNNGLMTIPGTVPEGTYSFTITANDAFLSATQNYSLTVTPAPVAPAVTSSNNKSVVNGTGGTFQVTAAGTTPITYYLSGAPAGVSIDGSSGIITIAAAAPVGTYPLTISVSNTVGSSNQAFTLTVTEAPVAPTITSADNTHVVNGTGGTFQITATGTVPFTYAIAGMPPDVSIDSTNGTMTIAGTIPVGTYTFTVTVTNGISPDATQTFTLTVTEAPVSPAITSADNTSVINATGGTFQITATGSSTIAYSVSGAPSGVSINSASGLMTIAASVPADTYTFTVAADNSAGTANQTFNLTVSPAPVAPAITGSNNKSVVNGTGGTFQVTATGTTPITYSISGAPAGVSLDSSSGIMTIDAAVPASTYTFTVSADNSVGTANQTFNLTVTPAPVAPAITSSNNKSVVNGTGGTFQVTATGTTPIVYSISGAPTGVSIDNSSGVITIDGTVSVGTYSFTISVSNSVGIADQTFTLTVTEAPVAPTITSVDNTHVVSGTGGTFQVTATGTLSFIYSIEDALSDVSIDSSNGTMTIAGTIPAGIYTYTVTVSNGISPDAAQAFTLTVTEAPVLPSITSQSGTSVISGTGGSYQLTVTGSTPVLYSITDAPSGVGINSANGLMTIDATTPAGTYTFTVTAENSAGTTSQTFNLTVTPAPVAPAITSSNSKGVISGTGGIYQVTTTGTTPITYSISGAPAGVSIDSSSGIMTIDMAVPVGTYPLTIIVSNAVGTSNQAFTLTVTEEPVAPTVTSVNNTHVVSGTGGTFKVTATGTLPFTYAITGAPSDVNIDSLSGTMTIAGTIPAGIYTFTVTVSNAASPDWIQAFTLTVTDAPALPVITSQNRTGVVAGTGGTFQVKATGSSAIVYSVTGAPPGVSINSANGLMTIAATVHAGTYTFDLTADNSAGTATQTFTLTVTAAPEAPSATPSPSPSPTPSPTTPSPSPSPTTPPSPASPSQQAQASGGTDPHTAPQSAVLGNHLVSDGSNWIEQDANGNQYGRWTWSAQDGMWMFEEFPTPVSQLVTDLLSTPLGIASLVIVALLIAGLIIWLFISHRTKRRR
jgi:hypothetical protein